MFSMLSFINSPINFHDDCSCVFVCCVNIILLSSNKNHFWLPECHSWLCMWALFKEKRIAVNLRNMFLTSFKQQQQKFLLTHPRFHSLIRGLLKLPAQALDSWLRSGSYWSNKSIRSNDWLLIMSWCGSLMQATIILPNISCLPPLYPTTNTNNDANKSYPGYYNWQIIFLHGKTQQIKRTC